MKLQLTFFSIAFSQGKKLTHIFTNFGNQIIIFYKTPQESKREQYEDIKKPLVFESKFIQIEISLVAHPPTTHTFERFWNYILICSEMRGIRNLLC